MKENRENTITTTYDEKTNHGHAYNKKKKCSQGWSIRDYTTHQNIPYSLPQEH